ncbi:energy-coupling factor ABC transporter ATP-binding protein [Brucella pseudogrignonensis]|uniref:Cobalt ABC transporter ATP-binding protein n=1 Tax=Brucella anthropi TaxID=529 RepID=A0A656Z6F5_BRUAN|nr:ABC transporter ATP-binding protein [Brucella pseudogrignonensis]KYB46052.1 cobalt ABC transporter ATP-binding protein [Brucella anthropi]MBK0023136.1 ABC transporter ATP-binding protein [Ochrobactrum sp. S45]MBK0045494.1 ABC transporter ATP-binding protein [Ochrobactrum sp. S46]UKK94873.1 energy-coupling factor ABC transporter ATP-binding protein [Brucella pseudogrignonensis]
MNILFDKAEAKFADKVVLEPLSLELSERRIGIIGLNGSGKSTFSRMVNGLVLPSSGRVLTNGHDTAIDGAKVRAAVGYIFQNPANQIVLPLIKDDVALGLQSRGLSKQELANTVSAVLDRIGIAHLSERRAHELSGGELQLAALASVLVTEPDIVIMDEPTNQLDLKNRNIVERTIRELKENVIVVSHDLTFLSGFDRVLLFHQGKLVEDGPADETIAHYLALVS